MPVDAARSLWTDTIPAHEIAEYPALPGDVRADVAIIGAGLTGLWTALHLRQRDPLLQVVVVERDVVGFGASGRNGGWCSALLPGSLGKLSQQHGELAARNMQQAMIDNVDDVVAFGRDAGLGDDCHLGGTVTVARTNEQARRLRDQVDELTRFGFGDEQVWLSATDVSEIVRPAGALGGVSTRHCATVQPLRLTHAIARAATSAGAVIHEHTAVETIGQGRVHTQHGTVTADVIVRATEGYSGQFAGQRRRLLPIYSMMIATEPLADDVWEAVGLAGRPTFQDGRRLLIYGQRTSDGRIAFGGRGAPYHFGSRVRPNFDTDVRVKALLTDSLRELFPAVSGAAITHHWGGVLAAPRDWTASVSFDRATGLATAGGYVGDGVATAHLAGRTLAVLITGAADDRDRALVELPWVDHASRRWEPEPLRWVGVNATRIAAARADDAEQRQRPGRIWNTVLEHVLDH
jgi:glycine/D-amino acid oxidase-like deaminating enzyme